MVSHRSLGNSKSPQVSRTLLSILADLHTVFWIVSTCPLIFKSSSPFSNLLRIVPCTPITIDIIVTFVLHSFFWGGLFCFFSSLVRPRYLSLFLLPFDFISGLLGRQRPLLGRFSFFSSSSSFDDHLVWSSGRDSLICLYLKIPDTFVHLILQDGFWVDHIPLFRMVKFQFHTQIPVDHLSHPVVSYLYSFCANLR